MSEIIFPVSDQYGPYVTSRYNPNRRHPVTGRLQPHNGTDYRTYTGAELYAIMDGTVTSVADNDPVGGNWVEITHPGNVKAGYSHMSRRVVPRGKKVVKGEIIGYSGSTGSVTAAHLHFGLKVNGAWVDPDAWLKRNNATVLRYGTSTPAPKPKPGS